MWITVCASLLCLGIIPGRRSEMGIKVFDFKLTETLGQDYSNSEDVINELEVDTADGKKTAHLRHKPSLFSEDSEVSLCGDETCEEKRVDTKLKKEMEKCTYEGALDADPNSKVTFSQCKGSTNLNLLSSKIELTSNTFRKVGNEIREHETTMLTDEIAQPLVEANVAAGGTQHGSIGADYAENGSQRCCRIRKKICTFSSPNRGGKKSCKTKYGRVQCDSKKCKKMRLRVEHSMREKLKNKKTHFRKPHKTKPTEKPYTKEPIENHYKKELTEKPYKKELTEKPYKKEPIETPYKKKPIEKPYNKEPMQKPYKMDPTEKPYKKKLVEKPYKKKPTEKPYTKNTIEPQDGNVDTEENMSFSEETDEYEDETTEYSMETKENKEGSQWHTKALEELDQADLDRILQETKDHSNKKKSDFRSIALQAPACEWNCKEENPKEKKYNQRTIELGVVTDKYLWQEVQNQMPDDTTEEDVKNQMMRMVHSIFVSTETFMMHPSISKYGGYKLKILGATIWKGDINKHAAKIHEERGHVEFLNLFREYVKDTNEVNDGNPKSYDMMILLSGAKQNLGISPNSDKGMAYIGMMCNVDAAMYSTVTVRNASHVVNIGPLIAHEIGHVLGASHDGEADTNVYSATRGDRNTCKQNKNIMTPSQRGTITEWSKCSRDYIDAEYDRREKDMPNVGNCYYT